MGSTQTERLTDYSALNCSQIHKGPVFGIQDHLCASYWRLLASLSNFAHFEQALSIKLCSAQMFVYGHNDFFHKQANLFTEKAKI